MTDDSLKQSTPSELREFARRLEPFSFLGVIGAATRLKPIHPMFRYVDTALRSGDLADLARAVILYGATWRRPRASLEDLRVGMNLVQNLAAPLGEPTVDQDPAFLFLYRLAVKQFPDQYSHTQRIARLLVLFHDLPESISRLRGYDPDTRFRAATGLSITEFLWCTLAIYAVARRESVFTPQQVANHGLESLGHLINEKTVQAVLKVVGTSLTELRADAAAELAGIEDDPLQMFAFNPLATHPAISQPNGTYLVPIAALLLRRLLDAPYYVLLDQDHAEFTEWLGPAFEEYVGWLLRPIYGDRLGREIAYGKTGMRSPEWLVDEGDHGVALLECKTKRLPKSAKTTGPADDVQTSFVQVYGGSIRQLHRFIGDVPKRDELSRFRGRQLEPLIVVLDPLYLANSPVFEKARGRAHAQYDVPEDFNPQVVTVEGLEQVAVLLKTTSLSAISRSKRADSRLSWNDWTTHAPTIGGGLNQELEERYEAFFDGVIPRDRRSRIRAQRS